MRQIVRQIVLVAVASLAAAAALPANIAPAAPRPAQDVGHARHANLQEAQALAARAFELISAAQRANEFDMGGHALRAKELLDQANNELKQAATTANRNER